MYVYSFITACQIAIIVSFTCLRVCFLNEVNKKKNNDNIFKDKIVENELLQKQMLITQAADNDRNQ